MSTIEKDVLSGRRLQDPVGDQEDELSELKVRLEEWWTLQDATPKRDALFTTISGREVKPVYTALDRPRGEEELGFPGSYPFTRGPYTTMYRTRLWTKRQFAGFATAEETNERYKYLLEHGQTGLSVAFDFPTLMGYDSDHARSLGEVGVCGVAWAIGTRPKRTTAEVSRGITLSVYWGTVWVLLVHFVCAFLEFTPPAR